MENLVIEKSNINTKQINKENNWTEILYNIVDNYSDECSITKNSEDSISANEDKKEKKKLIRETNNNLDTIEKGKKNQNIRAISPTKNQIYSNNEDLTQTENIKEYEKRGILKQI